MALSVLGRSPHALHGLGTYFAPSAPYWPDTQLVRDDERARALAEKMDRNSAIVLRGNGAVTAGTSLEQATAFAFFLEDAAWIELQAHCALDLQPIEYSQQESADRAAAGGGLIERMWHYLCFGDPEWQMAE
jgi:HCOMODA/2-hydroxy-3-carboxy-muconic semialdehyde decarboxylase